MIKVYVQELATYNNAISVGKWIDVDNFDIELEKLLFEATKVLIEQGFYYGVGAEEWEIVDYECEEDINISNIYQDIDTLKQLSEILKECEDNEISVISFLFEIGYSVEQLNKDLISEVRIHSSWDEAIEEFIEYYLNIEENSSAYSYLDYNKIQKDLEIEGYIEHNQNIYYLS